VIMTVASAPGKSILVGEHAVVYGQPAIAAPVWEVSATATLVDLPAGSGCTLLAPDIDLALRLSQAPDNQPLALVVRLTLAHLGLPADPDWRIDVRSTIPIASGLGSGAALSAALVRVIFGHAGQPATSAQVSDLVLASERLYHGTPSGIDNAVIAYGLPIWFRKGEAPVPFRPQQPLTLVIADSGIAAPTKETVGEVRQGWQANPTRYEAWFAEIGAIARAARQAIEQGALADLGRLFDENQAILAQLGVSSDPLERLIQTARAAGALGAKLSGGGRGGNVIALARPVDAPQIAQALAAAGARRVITTTVV
jgi:mevalonate kinase